MFRNKLYLLFSTIFSHFETTAQKRDGSSLNLVNAVMIYKSGILQQGVGKV